MSYDTVVAYARFAFVVVNMKVVLNYLAEREICNAQRNIEVMRHAIPPLCYILLY